MRSLLLALCALGASFVSATPLGSASLDESSYNPEDILETDVAVIGGGATGTYASLRLKDEGKSVIVIERAFRLGGHVDTYKNNGVVFDYGVQAYISNNYTTNFFGRFGVQLNQSVNPPFPSKVVDFRTGFVVPNTSAIDPNSFEGPLANYLFTAAQYPFLSEGFYDLPDDIPEDLLMPFGQFVAKYNLTEALQVVWIFANAAAENFFEQPTLYALQSFGEPHLLGLANGYFYAPEGNQEVYDKALDFLGSDVLLKSQVVASKRTDDGVVLAVADRDGNYKLIKAGKLLITIPPTVANLAAFDLDDSEISVFQQWNYVPYHVGVLSQSGLADLTNYLNVDVTQQGGFPVAPFVWRLETVGVPGYQIVKVIGEPTSSGARHLVADSVQVVDASTGGSSSAGLNFERFEEHQDHGLYVSVDALKAGFYRDLYALQGKRSTLWTGNAWCSDYSPLLWAYTEERVLPALIQN